MSKITFPIDLGKIRHILIKNIPWSPLDFIKEISKEGDKEIFIDRITSNLNQENDLRFIYEAEYGQEIAVFAERLQWDSNFFGYNIARLNGIFSLSEPFSRPFADYSKALEILLKLAKEKGIKYLFALVDARDLALIRSLGNLGFCLIETRVYYHRSIKNYEYKERYKVRMAEEKDIESLAETAVRMVNIYDRFHSDPFISPEDANRLMYKWVEASIKDNFADITIVPDCEKPKAFCTVKYHRNNWDKWGLKVAQPVFSAVSIEFKGWYRKIISEINYHLKDIGVEHCYCVTQIVNFPVISVWESLGFHFGKCEHVLRIVF